MWNTKRSVYLSIVVCIALSIILFGLIFFGLPLFELFMTHFRGVAPESGVLEILKKAFAGCFYPSALFAGMMLYALLKLLFNIKNDDVFIRKNVTYLKMISWGCFIIGTITLAGCIFYMPFLFVSAAGGFTGILLRVLSNVMQRAVELKEENDLTI